MGNGYNQQQQHLHERSTYLPMLCSRSRFTSIKDVHLPKCQHHHHHHLHLSSSSKSNDPSSPRVSCMGQVNRNNSRVIGLPTSYRFTTSTTKTSTTNIKYHKLKRLFSGRNLTTTTTTTAAATRGRGHIKSSDDNDYGPAPVNIATLDPPLPVVKRVQQQAVDGGDGVNLWKRRSGGAALKNLQLQQIHIPNNNNNNNNNDNHYLQPTTV